MRTRRSISVLLLVFNRSSAWLRTLLLNYPTFSQCAAYFHPNETCVCIPLPPHLHGHTYPFSHYRCARVRCCWIKWMDLPLLALVTTYMAIMNEFTLLNWGRVVEEQEKKWQRSICNEWGDHTPICPCHMFSMAAISRLFGAFRKSWTLQKLAKSCKCTYLCIYTHGGAHKYSIGRLPPRGHHHKRFY